MNAPLECVRDLQIPEVTPILSSRNGFDLTPIKPLPPIISGHDLLHQELILPDELVEAGVDCPLGERGAGGLGQAEVDDLG